MKTEDLLDAIGALDEDLIVEAEEKPTRRRLPLWQVATAAAAVLAVCVGLYLVPAMQPAGTAAPESQGTDGALRDVHSMIADGVGEDYEYRTDEFKANSALADKAPAVEVGGAFEPVFRTEQGRYLLIGEDLPHKTKLPEDVRYLGELAKTDYDEPVYPSVGTAELVGCPVWESEDGESLYIQTPAGGWLQATRSE